MTHLLAELDHLEIQSPNPAQLAAFYARALQMDVTEAQAQQYLCEGRHRRMIMVPGQAKGLGYLAYRLEDEASLKAFRNRIAAAGAALEPFNDPFFKKQSFSVVDPDGNRVVFGAGPRNQHSQGFPARLQHLALGTTNIEPMIAFYTNVLGMRPSDNVYADDNTLRSTFLRAGNEHHVLAIFQAGNNCFDHHCYEAETWDLIRDWADYLSEHDIGLDWGPGRHGPGNNLFFMIRDPDDNWLEISAELEIVADDRPVGHWQHREKTLNSWGKAYLRS